MRIDFEAKKTKKGVTLRVSRSKRSFWFWIGLKIGLIQEKPLSQSQSRLKEIKRFDEWLAYIKETDPQAIDELTELGKDPLRERKR